MYDDTPAGLRRLLLVAYAVSVPTAVALLALEAIPSRRTAGVLAQLATAAAGVLWLLARRRPGTLDWILAGVVVPTACAWIGFAATGDELPATLVLGALIPWSAVLYEPLVVGAMWALATADCFAMSASASGAAVGARHAAAFAILGGAIGWMVLRKTRSFREAHFRILESHLNDMEFIISPGGDVLAVNDRAAEVFGYSRQELLSMNVAALVPPDRRDALRAGLAEAARGGVVAEIDHVRKDGTRFPVEVSSRPFTARRVTYIHALLRDVSARRAAEQEHRFLAALVDQMHEGVVTIDPEGRIRTWSPGAERICGWSADEVVGRSPLSCVVPASSADGFLRSLAEAREHGVVQRDVRRLKRSGQEMTGSVTMVALRDEHGEPDGVLTVIRDVTAERAAEAALCESQRRLSAALEEVREEVSRREKLLAVVAHDLRSPLAAIALIAAGLEDLADSERARLDLAERAGIVRDAAHRMRRLVDDLVDVTAIERGALRVTLTERDPRHILDAALQQLRPVAAHRRIDLVRAELPPCVPLVRCDEGRILQALTNLVGNALAYTPPGGVVTTALAAVPGGVQFTVRDSGPGLSDEIAAHLFEPYRRGPDSQQKGAGLGLAITKGIVDAHGGRIWAASTPGVGATFQFVLPGEPEEARCPG